MKCQSILFSSDQASMALQVNSVPFSETTHVRLAALIDQRRQFACHPPHRDRGVGDGRQTFPCHEQPAVAEPPTGISKLAQVAA
jgi:hypothetical protein